MNRLQRVRAIFGLVGVFILAYIAYKGRLDMTYLGITLGFAAGFMVDASAREKSLADNVAMGLFLSGVLGYIDMYGGITDMVRQELGSGFILAAIALALLALVGSLMDEVRVGRTVRISYLPTVAMILALLVMFQAVSIDTTVSYTRTSYPPSDVSDIIRRYNATYANNFPIPALPVVNGTKVVVASSPINNGTVAYLKLFIYNVANTSRVRHAGNLSLILTMSPAPSVLPRDPGDLALRCLDNLGNIIHQVLPAKVDYNASTGVANVTFTLSSIDVYYANIAYYVMIYIDVHHLPASSISVSLDMEVIGQKVLDHTMAYIALGLEGLAALLAMPEDTTRRVSRRVKRRRRR